MEMLYDTFRSKSVASCNAFVKEETRSFLLAQQLARTMLSILLAEPTEEDFDKRLRDELLKVVHRGLSNPSGAEAHFLRIMRDEHATCSKCTFALLTLGGLTTCKKVWQRRASVDWLPTDSREVLAATARIILEEQFKQCAHHCSCIISDGEQV